MGEAGRDPDDKRFVRLDLVDAFSRADIHIDFLRSLSDELIEELVDLDPLERKKRINIIVQEYRKECNKLKNRQK